VGVPQTPELPKKKKKNRKNKNKQTKKRFIPGCCSQAGLTFFLSSQAQDFLEGTGMSIFYLAPCCHLMRRPSWRDGSTLLELCL
jgi:hypothetical protein